MESIQNSNNHPIDLIEFFDHYGCTLPRTVKLVDGFCGTDDDDTLEADQIFVFYKVERQNIIIALDEFRQEICIQQNSNTKVHLLPLECHSYSTVQELITAQSRFVLVLVDIPATGIVSGSKLKVLSDQNSVPNYLKCQVVDHDDPKDVLLPFNLTGKFLPLLDTKEYYLDEVLAQNELPLNVRFVSQRRGASDRFGTHSLSSLGNIRLMRRAEEEMVFAATFETELLLYLFPKILDISVSWGFKISAETNKKIKECRKIFETSERTLPERLDHEIRGSYYFTTSPVRRFNLHSLHKTAPMPLPRSPRAKRRQLPEKFLSVNRNDSTTRDRVSPASNNSCSSVLPCHGEIKEDGDYENYKTVEMPGIYSNIITTEVGNTCSAVSQIQNEVIYSNVITATKEPAPTPKTRSSSSRESNDKKAKPQSFSPALPKPRIRLKGVEMAGSDECASPMVQSRSGIALEYPKCAQRPQASSEDEFDECCPELPPRPIFLQQLLYINNGENKMPISQQDSPPALPPRNSVKYGEKARPKQHHIENEGDKKPCSQGETAPPPLPPRNRSMAYLAVDVTDWENIEDSYGAYTPVKDDGNFLTHDSDRNSYVDVIFEPDETENYLITKDLSAEENKRHCPDKPCQDREMLRLREAEVAQKVEGKSSKDDELYEELNNSQRIKSAEKQSKPGMKRPSRNCSGIRRSRSTQCSAETRETIVRIRLCRQTCTESEVAQQLQKESRKNGEPYEEVQDSQIEFNWPCKHSNTGVTKCSTEKRQVENMDNVSLRDTGMEGRDAQKDKKEMDSSLLKSKFRGATKANNEKKQGEKKRSKNYSSVDSCSSSSRSRECSLQNSREEGVMQSSTRNKKKIWISARRDEDCVDFKDIGQFFKLKKELNAAHAQVEYLKKQVAVKEKSPTERTQQMIDSRTSNTSYASSTNVRNTQNVRNDSKEQTLNVPDSTKAICKQDKGNIQNSTGFRDGSGKNMENTEKTVPGREDLTVHEHKMNKTNDSEMHNNYDDDDFYEKPISVENELAYHGSNSPKPNDSETYNNDDDFYEKPILVENELAYHGSNSQKPNDSEIYNDDDFYEKPISVENELAFHMDVGKEEQSNGKSADDELEPIYYNKVVDIETATDETSLYLQLLNPSDEDEDIYVNIDGQDSYADKQKLHGTEEATNNVSTHKEENLRRNTPFLGKSIFYVDLTKCSGEKDCCITKRPPLPPRKCVS